jgi:hypothetical protein
MVPTPPLKGSFLFDSDLIAGKANHVPSRQPLPKNDRNALLKAGLHGKVSRSDEWPSDCPGL